MTGRFFEPRPSEEFYDNFKDFHNIDNQIDDPLHQTKIKELKKELRRQQLKYFDSGLMPEEMRNRIIKEKKNGPFMPSFGIPSSTLLPSISTTPT